MTLLGTNVVESANSTGTITVTTGAAIGSTVFVGVAWESGAGTIPAITGVTDARGNTYVVDVSAGGAGNGTVAVMLARGRVTTALQTGDVITVTLGENRTRWALQADAFTDVDVSPLDRTAQNNNPGSSTAMSTGTTAATTSANERVIGLFGFASGGGRTATPDPGWSGTAQVGTNVGSADRALQIIYKTVSATGTQQGTATLSSSGTYCGAIATYRLASLDDDVEADDSAGLTETPAVAAATEAADSGTVTESVAVAVIGEPEFTFAIDWGGDGTFDGPHDDVTGDVLASGYFTASYGRDQVRSLSPPAAGRAAFALNNLSGDYSPENGASPLAGDILPARPFRSLLALDGVTRTLFYGHLDDYNVKVERNDYTVEATALDALADLQGVTLSTPLYQGVRTGTAIGYLLDAVGWPADKRVLDPGATLIRWWWMHEEDAWTALLRLVDSEGPGALVHADEDGRVVFRDRHHRLLSQESTTGQAVLTDGAGGYEPAFSVFSYDHGWRDIVNTVSFSVEELDPAPVPEQVWESSDQRSIPGSGSITLEIQTNDPVVNVTVACTVTAGTVTATLTQVTARSFTLQLAAGVVGAGVSQIVLTGQPVTARRTYQIDHSDAGSIAKYGARSGGTQVEAPWAGVHDALAIAQLIVGARAERLPVVTVTLKGVNNHARLAQQAGRDLSDRIHIIETRTGLAQDFFLDQITHRVLPGGVLETEFGLEQAAQQVADAFRFDDDEHGFDDGVFGSPGLDDPQDLFLFDVAGRGFDDGLFAT